MILQAGFPTHLLTTPCRQTIRPPRLNGPLKSALSAGIAIFALNLTTARAGGGDETDSIAQDERSTWSFVWENDYFAQTDQNYTNGVRIAYFSGAKQPSGVSEAIARNIFNAGDDAVIRRGFAVGHSIFTPSDIDTAAPLPDQHPYAGWLYGEYSVVVEQRDIIDQVTIQAGVVGPSAGGEFVQNNWHRLIGGDPALGWDNQIDDEFGIVLSYDRKFRKREVIDERKISIDVTPSFGASIGNVRINARAGLTFRIGQDLRNDYGPPRVRPSLAGSGYFSPRDGFSWHVFFGVEGRAVAHDIFLDGSLFREDDPSVTSKALVGDFQTGLVTQIERFQIAYTYVVRTKEFEEQIDNHRFGAVSLSVKF